MKRIVVTTIVVLVFVNFCIDAFSARSGPPGGAPPLGGGGPRIGGPPPGGAPPPGGVLPRGGLRQGVPPRGEYHHHDHHGRGSRIIVGGYFGFPYYGYPYRYYPYAPYYYYYPYPYPYYSSAYEEPTVYAETEQPYYWYYCADPEGYYPYVKSCPGGWARVIPTPTEKEEAAK